VSHYQPYPAYKESGVEWLGRVPENWDIRAVKTLARLDGGSGFPEDEQGQSEHSIPFFKVAELVSNLQTTDNTVSEATAKRLGAKIFQPNTLVFAKVGAALLLNRRCLLEVAACLDNNMMALSPTSCSPRWLFWVFSIIDMGLIANPGAVPSINQEQVGNIRLCVPSLDEQLHIVARLDRETARLDALVEKKTRFIELLHEKRQALITHAVTKGLDPNVKMKDSGVEWLGEVPEHWLVTTVSRLFEIKAGGDLKEDFFSDVQDEVHCYPIYTNSVKLDAVYGYTSKAFYLPNTISVSGRGEIGHAVYRENAYDAIIRLLVLTPKSRKHCKYSAYFINAVLDFHGGSTAVSQLSAEQIAPYLMLNPSDKEQIEISIYLDNETSRIDTLINKTERSIGLLKERRSALITAAVTGQLDLQEAI